MLAAVKTREDATTGELVAAFKGATEADAVLVLQCLLAAQRVARVEEEGVERWLPRA